MKIDIFADIACPWCYIGKRRFERALAGFAHRDAVDVEWRSFELQPHIAGLDMDTRTYMIEARHLPPLEVQEEIRRVGHVAEAEGLQIDLGRLRVFNTRQGHELLHFAKAQGRQEALKERLMAAGFTDGADLGDRDVLLALAADVGLDTAAAAEALDSGAFRGAVADDEIQAAGLGVTSVPYFLIDGHLAIAGAQSPAVLRRALEEAWAASEPPVS